MKNKFLGILESIWKVARIIWIIAIIIFIAAIVITPPNAGTDLGNAILWAIYIAIIALLVVALVGIEVLRHGFKNRCPACKKWFALKKLNKEFAYSKDVSVLTEVNTYNNSHQKTGTQEQYVSGTRDYYHINYKCKKCGNECYSTSSKLYKNT